MRLNLTQSRRLQLVITITFCFFVTEISVGFYTSSLALVADAFHYLNDLIGFVVAFAALKVSGFVCSCLCSSLTETRSPRRKIPPPDLSFGWQRARLLGAFFNGVFLIALAVSIFLQSIERFISVAIVKQPQLMLIVGCIGLALNIISAFLFHDHGHSHGEISRTPGPAKNTENIENGTEQVFVLHENHRHNNLPPSKKGYDLGVLGVLIHVLGDAANNIGVIISALVIWLTAYPARYYADPAVSMGIALVILATSIPLLKSSGKILLESVSGGINLEDIRHDLEMIEGVLSVHELHVWRLNQEKAVASAHAIVSHETVAEFVRIAKTIKDCFHSYGVHSTTVQPELESTPLSAAASGTDQKQWSPLCRVKCGTSCELLTCCG